MDLWHSQRAINRSHWQLYLSFLKGACFSPLCRIEMRGMWNVVTLIIAKKIDSILIYKIYFMPGARDCIWNVTEGKHLMQHFSFAYLLRS